MTQSASQPDVSLIGAALIMQVALVFILAMAAAILHHGERRAEQEHGAIWELSGKLAWAIIALLVLTFVPLLGSNDFGSVWARMFPNVPIVSLSTPKAMTWMFVVDIGIVAALILWTGGSKDSVFTSALGILPALAIFLREPFARVAAYSFAVFVALWYTYRFDFAGVVKYNHSRARATQIGNLFVNGASIALTTLLGYVTR